MQISQRAENHYYYPTYQHEYSTADYSQMETEALMKGWFLWRLLLHFQKKISVFLGHSYKHMKWGVEIFNIIFLSTF